MLESYVTPLLMSYVNKYIKNLKPSDLQLSLWGGDVVLSKLDLKLDVLEQVLYVDVVLCLLSRFIRRWHIKSCVVIMFSGMPCSSNGYSEPVISAACRRVLEIDVF